LSAALGIGLTGCSSTPAPVSDWGGWPSFLPSHEPVLDKTLNGSTASPALSIQGEAINVTLPSGGTVLVTTLGPALPDQNRAVPEETIECTWTITFQNATTSLNVTNSDFRIRDSLGGIHLPAFTDDSGPGTVKPGATSSFKVKTTLPEGEGLLSYAPDGKNPVATWDFIVEDD